MKKKMNYVIVSIIIVLLLFVLYFISSDSNKVINLTSSNFYNTVSNNNFSLVFYGEQTDTNLEKLANIRNEKNINVYTSNISNDDYSTLFNKEETPLFDFFIEGELLYTIKDEIDDQELDSLINKYFFNIIPDDEISYKVLNTANEYIKKVNSNKLTVAIFGYSECNYCTLYMPIFNDVAKKYKLNIYYFDRDNYDENEYDKIMDLNLTIPKECTMDNKETTFKNGFPKPMTIITKKGKVVDCIKGYVKEEDLVSKLKKVGVIK